MKKLLLSLLLGVSVAVGYSQGPIAANFRVASETPTEYPGGMDAFNKYIAENLKYPRDARKEGVSGNVLVEFKVDSDGLIIPGSVRALKRLHPSCDEEATRLVRESGPWVPASYNGRPVAQIMAVKISFYR